ncbi:ATP-binding protein [Candidatus Williamhamiltonella defendens]|uniref:ATP-binding protein n=1 Tax=Candidatus Williamhamiltonella defendens TaxID=138072 RepID=UPI0015819504|nr:ATP-binding protein [Candidatus Hamiltonella defensa]
MGTVSLILGESGTGKTASLRHLNPETCLLIQSIQKPLPFPAKAWRPWAAKDPHSSIYVSDLWQPVKMALSRAYSYGKRIAVVDDFQYIMANEFMRRGEEKSYDKFTEIAHHTWDILHHTIHHTPPDLRVYFLSHSEDTASGKIKMKTLGKLLDEKITLEGMFTTVLRTCVKDGRYLLSTQNNGFDTVKSPMGLFDSAEIDNDLSFVDAALCDYYQLTPSQHTTGAIA